MGKSPPAAVLESVLLNVATELNGAGPLRRATLRTALVKDRGLPAKMVDAVLGPNNAGQDQDDDRQGSKLALADPEPWPEPVEGAYLLDELCAMFERYLVLPEHASVLMALWVAFAHALDAFRIAPQLAFLSAVRECGKSTTLELLHAVLPRAVFGSNITPAGVFRVVEKFRPALLIDEADNIFGGPGDELRTIFNASHLRTSAKVIRCDGVDFEPREYSTWCPKVLAKIGPLPPTLDNRAFVVRMQKSKLAGDEAREPCELDTLEGLAPLKRQAIRWAADSMQVLKGARPETPGELRARQADNARPLLAIAELAGGEWPARARAALVDNLTRGSDDETETMILMLADLRELFRTAPVMRTRDILDRLAERDERPWGEWRNDKPMTGHALAALLKPFGIRPTTVRFGETPAKSYRRADFEDVFSRYLPDTRNES